MGVLPKGQACLELLQDYCTRAEVANSCYRTFANGCSVQHVSIVQRRCRPARVLGLLQDYCNRAKIAMSCGEILPQGGDCQHTIRRWWREARSWRRLALAASTFSSSASLASATLLAVALRSVRNARDQAANAVATWPPFAALLIDPCAPARNKLTDNEVILLSDKFKS